MALQSFTVSVIKGVEVFLCSEDEELLDLIVCPKLQTFLVAVLL